MSDDLKPVSQVRRDLLKNRSWDEEQPSDDIEPIKQRVRINFQGESRPHEIKSREEATWATNQKGEPPTFRIGVGKKAKSIKVDKTRGIAKILPKILPNYDPRVIPEITPQYIKDMYGGNKLNMVMNKQQVRELQAAQRNKAALRPPLIQGRAFGERSNAQIAAQKKKLRAMADDHPADLVVDAGASKFVADF